SHSRARRTSARRFECACLCFRDRPTDELTVIPPGRNPEALLENSPKFTTRHGANIPPTKKHFFSPAMTKILVIEDEADTLDNLVLMLQMEGFTAIGAPDGGAGVTAALREHPDLILCDVSMPGLDGHG